MIRVDAISHIVQFDGCTGALFAPVSASIAHLKVNGTESVASFAISSSTIDQTTRILRSTRSPGQMYGHRCASVPIRVACSTDRSEEGCGWRAPGDAAVSNPSMSKIKPSMNKIKTVCVYCGSGPGTNPRFVEAAIALGKILADNGVGLVS